VKGEFNCKEKPRKSSNNKNNKFTRGKDLNRYFSKDDIEMANGYVEK
jgi:hypothetical protein